MSDLPLRFWSKVDVTDTCWTWTAATSGGYGRFYFEGRVQLAHRVAYEALVGPVPADLHLDHLCRNRACVNPLHIEPVTCKVNVLRGVGPSAQHVTKTHCPAGHAYDAANTYSYRGMRMCRACRDERGGRRHVSPAAEKVRADPSDPRRGSLTAYSTYRCRCDRCRATWRTYQADRRQKAAA